MIDDDDETEHRIYGMQIGTVVDVTDPEGAGRIRAIIPGLHEPAGPWAWPIAGAGGGGPAGGAFVVPPVGQDVAIWFKDGDPDHPYYLPANYGTPTGKPRETPTPVRELPVAEVPLLAAFEWGTYVVVIDNRPGQRALYLRDKRTGDELQHDAELAVWRLKGSTAVFIESDGRIQLSAPTIIINERVVRTGPGGI